MSHRIGNLEARTCNEYLTNNEPFTTIEIVEWYVDEGEKDLCITIAFFVKDSEGFHLKSVGERIVLDEEKWESLGILVGFSFRHLNKFAFEGKGEKKNV